MPWRSSTQSITLCNPFCFYCSKQVLNSPPFRVPVHVFMEKQWLDNNEVAKKISDLTENHWWMILTIFSRTSGTQDERSWLRGDITQRDNFKVVHDLPDMFLTQVPWLTCFFNCKWIGNLTVIEPCIISKLCKLQFSPLVVVKLIMKAFDIASSLNFLK